MNKLYALDVLQRFETHLGDLYQLFAERLQNDPEVAALFGRMALDEYGHAELVGYQRRMVEQEPKLLESLDLDEREIYLATAQVKEARNAAPTLKAEDAVGRALSFETAAADYHFRMAKRQIQADLGEFLVHLGRADEEHQARLERLICAVGLQVPIPL
ncbi:MAG: hypothetical protein LAO05_07210 [Acidobacteriia bacterium]|nr:hypothetical protein [Terriglobia bacterium]